MTSFILMSSPQKGDVLNAFIDKIEQKPKWIIFIDDTSENIESIEMEMIKRGIEVIGLHYVEPQGDTSLTISESDLAIFSGEMRERLKRYSPYSGTIQTAHIKAIEWALEIAPKDCLGIFDMGNVILSPKDAALSINNHAWVKSWMLKHVPQINDQTFKPFAGIIDREAEMELVNPLIASLVNAFKNQNKSIILSKYWCGDSGKGTFQNQRNIVFHEVGIDLGEPFPEMIGWTNETLKAAYENGLIVTETPLKGPVSIDFLNHLNWKPQALIFVDDRKEQCDSIAQAGKELGIPTLCINYTEDKLKVLDPEVAELQLRTLFNEKRWIADEQAQHLLQTIEKN